MLGKDFPRVAEIALDARPGTATPVVAAVANGDGGEFAHYVLGMDGSVPPGHPLRGQGGGRDASAPTALYLISRQGAPQGKLLKLKLDDLALEHAQTLVPESDAVMQTGGEFGGAPITITPRALYVREIVGGPSQVAIFDHDGKAQRPPAAARRAAVDQVEALDGGSLLVSVRHLPGAAVLRALRRSQRQGQRDACCGRPAPSTSRDAEVVREFAVSKDGTRCRSTSCARRALKLDGSEPAAAERLRRLQRQPGAALPGAPTAAVARRRAAST